MAGPNEDAPVVDARPGTASRGAVPVWAVLAGVGALGFVVAWGALGSDFLAAVLRGLSFGSVYALLAVGLVLAYRTTGVFNLAFGPQAFLAAAVYYWTHIEHDWPMWLALIATIGVVSPLVGAMFDVILFRFLRNTGEIAKLVTVLGLFVAIPELVFLWFKRGTNAVGIVPDGRVTYEILENVRLTRDEIAIILVGIAIIVGLSLMFRYTAIGLRMRAVVESPRLTELAGVDAERVSMSAWALSSAVAGLAGVLLAPVFAGQVDYVYYQRLVIAAIAAAVIGQLNSLTLAFAGGLALGVTQQLLDKYLPTNSFLASTLRPALPFVIGFAVLALSPAVARRRAPTDPLAGVDPPPPALAAHDRPRGLTIATRVAGVVFCSVVGFWLFFSANDYWVSLAVRAAILAIVFLSITVITGLAGQVSLCQASFAALGAAVTSQLAIRQGMSVLVAMLIGGAAAALMGALVALPVLRLGGIFLSLATLAFAYFFDAIILQFTWLAGGTEILNTPRPQVGPIDMGRNHDLPFFGLCLVVFTILAVLVIWVRNGTTGRYFDALRGSETAAASIGINRNRARIVAMSLSAFIAGVGGGLFASFSGNGNATTIDGLFGPEFGLVFVVLVVTLGARTIEGAINAAIGFVFVAEVVLKTWIPWLVNHVQPWYHLGEIPRGWQTILFGLGAITYAKHPEGILEFNKRKSSEQVMRVAARFTRRDEDTAPPAPPAPDVTEATAGSAP